MIDVKEIVSQQMRCIFAVRLIWGALYILKEEEQMKNIMKKSLSVVMIVVLCLTIAPLKGFVGAELIKSKAAYVEETLDEKNTLYQTYYIDKHIEFINSDHYYNMKNYERWAYYLEEAASSTVKDIAAGVHDMLSVADSLINLDFNGIPVASNAYTTVVTSLFADADTSNIFTEIYEKYIDLESVGFFTKLKKLCQDSGKWSNSINFDVEIQHLWNLNISDYESNSFCVFITDCLETQGVSKMQSMGLFADIEAYSEISGCIGSVSSLIDALVRWGKYEATIKAFRNTSSEFKIVFSSLNGSGNAWLDNAVNTYLSCLDDEYASDYLKTKIVVDGVLTAINVGNDLFKPFIAKGAAKLYGVEASVAAACIFAFDFGFKLSNAITGNDAIVECKRLLRANSELEKRMYMVLTSYENKLLSTNSYNNAKLYDVAYNMYRNVQIFSLNSYSSMLDKQKDTVLNRILCWTKLRDVSDYEHEIKFCAENIALWQSSICHDPDVLITSDYLEINSNHMYTVACPTDVEVADSEGNKLVEIVADKLLHLDERCVAIVVDSIKVIVIPSSIKCIIKITGTDQGQMDYTIDEYNEGSIVRSLKYKDVPLEKGSEYIATVPDKIMQSSESYTLEDNNKNPVELYYDSLPPVEDNIVDVIVAEELFDGFPVEIIDLVADAMFNMKSVVDLSAYDISTDDAVALFSAVAKYYPAEYSLISNSDFTYKIIVSPNLDRIMKIRFYYGDDANLSAYQKRVKDLNAEINALVERVAGMNEFEKALYIHDYIVLNSEYDLELLDYMEKNNFILPGELRSEKYTEYSILVNGTGVCGSYALAYRAILNAAGMECLYLSSSQMNHAWNLVKIDGKWYHVDCCWDDPTPDTYGRARRTYFLRTDDEIMNLNHYSWTPGQYKANSEKYSDMPRNYDIKQKYDDGKWYYLTGSTLYSSDEYGKNETEITSISASSIDADNGNVYYSNGRYIYEYNIETDKTAPVYMLSNKDSGDKPSQAYLSNIYVDGENAEFYKSIYSDDKRITAYDIGLLQRNKFSSITGIEISQSEAELNVFETLKLSANIIAVDSLDALELEWSSSDENVVMVDESGKISAANVGEATITVKIFDYYANCHITVNGDGLSGLCGETVSWSFDLDSNKLSISGTGKMQDYSSSSALPWENFKEKIITVDIDENVSSIGACSFYDCTSIVSVFIPNSVTVIGYSAFNNCHSLEEIVVPDRVTTIEGGTFRDCVNLKKITIGKGVNVIDGSYIFAGCENLETIYYKGSISDWLAISFTSDAWTQRCSYDLYIGDELLKELVIPEGAKKINNAAFRSCRSLENVVIPKSVTLIGDCAFEYCANLKSITVDSGNKYYSSLNGVLFNYNKTTLIQYPAHKESINYTIPSSVTKIEDCAFIRCTNLENLEIPNSVLTIGNYAFQESISLESVNIGSGVTEFGSWAFCGCTSLIDVSISFGVTNIGGRAFQSCENLENIIIPSSVTSIDDYAFMYCSKLNSINIPDSVTEIGKLSFSGCTSLKSIIIGKNLKDIGDSAFYDCLSLESIICSDENNNYSSLDGVLFDDAKTTLIKYPSAKKTLHYQVPDGVSVISESAMAPANCLVNLTIPHSVTSIADYAITGDKLESISVNEDNSNYASEDGVLFNKSKTKIIKYPDNKELISYRIPNSVFEIGANSFRGCLNLDNVIVGNNVTRVSRGAFYDCSLKRILFLGEQCNIENNFLLLETLSIKIIIYGHEKSNAQKYAEKYGINFVNIDAVPHEHDYFIVAYEEKTTISDGYEKYWCYCGDSEYEVIVHNFGEEEVISNGCMADGISMKMCTVCGETEKEVIPAIGKHDYKLISTTPGTCTVAPVNTYECSTCGDTYTKTGKIEDGHSYEKTVVAPTCEEKGYTQEVCRVCDETLLSDFTSPKGHEFVINKSADYCSAHGTLEYSCKNCDYTESVASDAEDLVTETITVDSTCTKSGTRSEICTLCGATVSEEILNPLSHEYSTEYTVDKEATCTEEGQKSQHCIRCDAKRAVTVIEATGHQNTSIINVVESTCANNGYTGDTYCSDCKTVIATGESLSKLSHHYATVVTEPTCTSKGFTTHTCTACGDSYTDAETAMISHSYSSVVTPVSCTSNGYTTYTCIVCSHSYTSDTVTSTGHNYNDNGICVGCGKNRTENCSHMCHKSGFMGFIWKILRFFFKLFKIQPVCSCGVAHY